MEIEILNMEKPNKRLISEVELKWFVQIIFLHIREKLQKDSTYLNKRWS